MWHTNVTNEMRHTRYDIRAHDIRSTVYEYTTYEYTTYEPWHTSHDICDMTSSGVQYRHTRYDIRYTTYKIRHTRYDIRDMTYMIHHTWYNIRGKYIQTRYDIRDTAYAYLYYIIGTAIGILLTNMKLYLKHPKSSNTQYIFILWVKPAG